MTLRHIQDRPLLGRLSLGSVAARYSAGQQPTDSTGRDALSVLIEFVVR